MDPNETLKLLREATTEVLTDNGKVPDVAQRMAELVEALDGWLKKGGALPTAWAKPRPEQLFEVRLHCDGASLVVGRYFDYVKALEHIKVLKGREKEMAILGAIGADVVPVEVMP